MQVAQNPAQLAHAPKHPAAGHAMRAALQRAACTCMRRPPRLHSGSLPPARLTMLRMSCCAGRHLPVRAGHQAAAAGHRGHGEECARAAAAGGGFHPCRGPRACQGGRPRRPRANQPHPGELRSCTRAGGQTGGTCRLGAGWTSSMVQRSACLPAGLLALFPVSSSWLLARAPRPSLLSA
jgi:hypothetical protein